MKLPRRYILQLGGAIAAAAALPRSASALDYPVRPVRLIVGFPAGGPSDILARLIARWLTERLGQPFVVENQPGAASNIATATVVRALPDGYTLLLVGPANAINASLYDKLEFDFMRDIAPVAGLTREPLVMLVNPSVPASNGPQLIAYAKSNPGRIRLALTDPGSAPHASGELFRMMAGTDLAVRPLHRRRTRRAQRDHRGTVRPDVRAAVGVDCATAGRQAACARGHRRRRVRPALPDLPSVGDFVPGYEASAVSGIGVPRGTPRRDHRYPQRGNQCGLCGTPYEGAARRNRRQPARRLPTDFGRLMAQETEKWAKVVKFSAATAH